MKNLPAVYLNDVGILNSIGSSKEEVLENLLKGMAPGLVKRSDLLIGADIVVGAVRDDLPCLAPHLSRYESRNARLLLAACEQIAGEVEEIIELYGRDRVAVVLGTSTSGVSECESAVAAYEDCAKLPPTYFYEQHEFGSTSEVLAKFLGLTNLALTISTACSSSAKAFGSARNMIQSGICDAVLVGGVDTLCKLTVNGFSSLSQTSASICNPLSKNRDGITIGEAAALFILSKYPKGPRIYGVGESSDAHHISSPHPGGKGAESAMRIALQDAGLEPRDVLYLNMHGTGTLKNDEMESKAIYRIFGSDILCSSTKALSGHTLGAAGATELAFCWLALSACESSLALPPHIWDGERDPALPEISVAEIGSSISPSSKPMLMSNSFAFGGSNVSIIIGAE